MRKFVLLFIYRYFYHPEKKQKCPYILCLNLCLCLLKFTDVNFPYIYTVLKKVVLFNLLIFTINKELISYINPKIEWQTK